MRRQLYRGGGIASLSRQNYGIGSWVKERIRKLIPNELANIAVKAAPFVAPFYPGAAAAMRGFGRFDQRGSMSDAMKQAALTYAGGKGARYLAGADKSLMPFQGGGMDEYTMENFRGGPIGRTWDRMMPERQVTDTSVKKIPKKVYDPDALIPQLGSEQSTIKNIWDKWQNLGPGMQTAIVGVGSGALAGVAQWFENQIPQEPGESMEEWEARREVAVKTLMRQYMDNTRAYDPAWSSMTDQQKDETVGQYYNQGGRVGYQAGGITMANTLAQNIAANNAQRAANRQTLQQGRNIQQATGILDAAMRSADPNDPGGSLTDIYNKYFHGKALQGKSGFQRSGTNPYMSYTSKDRDQMIRDIAGQLGNQTTYTPPAYKPIPKTYRNVSPEAQALNMSQATYEDIIRSGADPRQYYMDYHNRMMTEGGNYGTPGTSSYTGPPLLTYGQVIGGPGMMGGMMGPGAAPGATPPTEAQINQMMQNNPAGYVNFDEIVKQYSSTDPYMSHKEEIKDMVGGRDTGYMSGADYYDQYVLGLSGQQIAEKYGIPYNQGGRVGLHGGGAGIGGLEDRLQTGAPSIIYEGDMRPNRRAQGGRTGYDMGGDVSDRAEMYYKYIQEMKSMGVEPVSVEEFNKMLDAMREKNAQGGRIGRYGGGMGLPGIPGIPRMAPDGLEYDMSENGGFQPLGAQEGKDDVKANLAKNEFVFTADAVRGAGGGNIELGAQRMYDTMKKLESRVA